MQEVDEVLVWDQEEEQTEEYHHGMNNSVIIKGSDTISNHLDPNMMLSFWQSIEKNWGETYDESNNIQLFDSSNITKSKNHIFNFLVISPSLNNSNSDCQK